MGRQLCPLAAGGSTVWAEGEWLLMHQPGGGRRPLVVEGDRQRVGDAHPELAPRPRLALDPDLAAEQTRAALHEREPHAEAGEAPRGRAVALGEELEELAHALGRDPSRRSGRRSVSSCTKNRMSSISVFRLRVLLSTRSRSVACSPLTVPAVPSRTRAV